MFFIPSDQRGSNDLIYIFEVKRFSDMMKKMKGRKNSFRIGKNLEVVSLTAENGRKTTTSWRERGKLRGSIVRGTE